MLSVTMAKPHKNNLRSPVRYDLTMKYGKGRRQLVEVVGANPEIRKGGGI